MLTYLVDADALESFARARSELAAPLRQQIRFVEYSEAPGVAADLTGAFLFTGVSLMAGDRLERMKRLESRFHQVLNQPSRVQPRLETLQQTGLRIEAIATLSDPRFPLSIRFDHSAGYVESPPVSNSGDLHDLLATMIMASYPLAGIWAAESLKPNRSVLAYDGVGGLDLCRVEYAAEKIWRIDDGPIALLPRPQESESFLAFARNFEPSQGKHRG